MLVNDRVELIDACGGDRVLKREMNLDIKRAAEAAGASDQPLSLPV